MTASVPTKRRKLGAFDAQDASQSDAENDGDVANANAMDPSARASNAALGTRKIAAVTMDLRPNDAVEATEDTYEHAMAALNAAFVAFVTEQTVLCRHGDLTACMHEYVAYARAIREKFDRVEVREIADGGGRAASAEVPQSQPPTDTNEYERASDQQEESAERIPESRKDADERAIREREERRRADALAAQIPENRAQEPIAAFGYSMPSSSGAPSGFSYSSAARPPPPLFQPGSWSSQPSIPAFGSSTVPINAYPPSPVRPPTFAFGSSSAPAVKKDAVPAFGGFLASANTLSTSSIWNDPALLRLKTDASAITRDVLLYQSLTTEVWRGVWRGTTPVALKRLALNHQTLERAQVFATNVKTIASLLHHPRIVTLVGIEWTKATEFQVASEWMDQGDLRSVLDTPATAASLTWANFKCQVAIDVAEALTLLHTQKSSLSHLPSSRKVLLASDGRAKLSVVHASDVAAHRWSSSVRYMAPEVILGKEVSSAADVYAFGVLLCELDTTRPPYDDAVTPSGAKMEDELVAQHVIKGLLRPSFSAECPEALAELVQQCVVTAPNERPTAAALGYALRAIHKSEL